jgi:amino acid adenylation domain-containing protein
MSATGDQNVTAQPSFEAVDYDPFADEGLESTRAVPITEPQREVWLADRLSREASLAYNESVLLRFSGALDTDALSSALNDLVNRHDALRAVVSADGATLVIPVAITIVVPLVSLEKLPEAQRQVAIVDAQRKVVETAFDLEHGPLFNAQIFRLNAAEHVLIMAAHHIVCDGWSFGILVRDLATLYRGRLGLAEADLIPAASFGDYAISQQTARGGVQEIADEAYWLSRFSGSSSELPILDLPTDQSRAAWRTFASSREDFVLDAALVASVRKAGAKQGASMFATLLAGFATTIHRVAASGDVVIGVPAAGQSVDGLDSLVGHCVNLMPIRIGVDPKNSMAALVAAAQTAMLDASEHQSYTFGTLLKKLALPRDPSRLSLVSVMFNLDQALDANTVGFTNLNVEFSGVPRSFENFELFVNAVQVDGGLRLECQYNADLFTQKTIQRWLGVYENLLRALTQSADAEVGAIAIVSADDLAHLKKWNDTAKPFSRDSCVHELFEKHAQSDPSRAAVRWADKRVSYGELNERANRIAHSLRDMGAAAGALVGLHVERGPDMVAAMLGVLKSGAAYVPLDPAYPQDRLNFMAEDAKLAALITDVSAKNSLNFARDKTLSLNEGASLLAAKPSANILRDAKSAKPSDCAYVIYTSGSTGKPKGVLVPHRAVVNFLESMAREPGLSADDRIVAVTTLSFDIAVNEFLLPLSVGAEIVLASRDEAGDGGLLASLIQAADATTMQATPATWRLLLERGWRSPISANKFKALCGGEALSNELAEKLIGANVTLWNMYGPTETTVWSTCVNVTDAKAAITIGCPIANTSVWVLDEFRQPCPIGVPGEIWIGGDGVTLGYLNKPGLTAERFTANPFSGETGARLYRTGDRGRWRERGNIEHMGRLDFQVKVRGYRIELGEIEASLVTATGIARAVVVAREDKPGDVRLVAYVVSASDAKIDDDALRVHLKLTLPEYMVPQHFVALSQIPLLSNGKTDRKSLPAPLAARAQVSDFLAPRTTMEKTVLAEMERLLGLPGMSVRDNFFSLGGHSLLAAQLATKLSKINVVQMPLRAVFSAPTSEALAVWIEDAKKSGTSLITIPRRLDRNIAPLSAMQQRVWFLEALDPGKNFHNTPSAHRLRGQFDEQAFQLAFDEMVRRQDVLRTIIDTVDDEVMQIILTEVDVNLLPVDDLRVISKESRSSVLDDMLNALIQQPFDLAKPPLFRAKLFRLDEEEYVFFFMAHHIIWDGWSFDLLYDEMGPLYEAYRLKQTPPLPVLAVTYGDFSAWQRDWMQTSHMAAEVNHWKARLSGHIEPLAIPLDLPRPAAMTGQGSTTWVAIEGHDIERLRQLATQHECTIFMALLALSSALLAELTGQQDIVIGTPVRGRMAAELESVMGFFVNAIPLRMQIDKGDSFASLLKTVRDSVLDGLAHPDVPMEQLVRELNVARDNSRSSIFQAMFSYQDARHRARNWGSLQHERVEAKEPGITTDLSLWCVDLPGRLQFGLSYNADIMLARSAELLRDRFVYLLRLMIADPRHELKKIPLVPSEATLLATWNNTSAELDATERAHTKFEQHAKSTPQLIAVSANAQSISYGELDTRANQLAQVLHHRGIGPGQLVGLLVERGFNMLVAQLAVLKSGAGYVPLDPMYPLDRLSFMVEDAALGLLISEEAVLARTRLTCPQILLLDADAATISSASSAPLITSAQALLPDDIAYVIYTSGSTGKPKGVRIPHSAVVNFLDSMRREPGLASDDVLLAVTTLSFDIAVLELLLPLSVGARIVLASRDQAQDGNALGELLSTSRATVMQATPATWRILLDTGWRGGPSFKGLVGGEALPRELATRLLDTGVELWNMYGPTETTVWSTCWRVENPEQGISIGRPIANTEVHILSPLNLPCAVGVAGEIWIGGAGVAAGYLNRSELTAERFIPNPFSLCLNARLYRTGDCGRWRADGLLEHLGRFDFQVKVHGHRIELGEIEEALAAHSSIAATVVIVREDTPGDLRLTAYCIAADAEHDARTEAILLRDYLRSVLPGYMVPHRFVFLDALPQLPNGKINRAALPLPPQLEQSALSQPDREPKTDMEKALAKIWVDLLKIGNVYADDNFFDLGGHSLLAMQAIQQMEKVTGKRANPGRFVFETLAQIARGYDELPLEEVKKISGARRFFSKLVGAKID